MKIYLAGRVSKRPILQAWAALLEQDGHEIVSRWSKRDSDHISVDGLSPRAADAERERFAREDIEDIRACDCMLSLMEEPRSNGRGGRHVEFGFGLALGKPQVIVGERETVFHHLQQVYHCDDIDQARRLLGHRPERETVDLSTAMPQHYDAAVAVARQHRRVYPTLLQRHLGIAYSNALQLIDHLEARGVVSAPDDKGCREVLAQGEGDGK